METIQWQEPNSARDAKLVANWVTNELAAKLTAGGLEITESPLKADEIAELGDAAALQARLDADPDDHQARFDLALIANAKGDRQTAASLLLDIIKRDRAFDDDGARRKLLEFFVVWGSKDPATRDARRRLSSLLFS